MHQISNFQEFVMVAGDHLVTDSRKVARAFGKQHKNVLRAIEEMRANTNPEIAEHGRLNFEPSSYVNRQNKVQPQYLMTKDGLAELAMSFTGDDARVSRIRFIAAFNAMAEQLAKGQQNLWQQMQALIAREVESKVRASFGSHLMLKRKREIPPLRTERGILEAAIQPSLLN